MKGINMSMTKEELAARAVTYKHSGYNCCQAVVKTFMGDNAVLMDVASGFGMGMGCMEATCGALIGANIVLGAKGKGRCARVLLKRFEELSGATVCNEIKGRNTGIVLASCDDCVKNAVIALWGLLDE